MTSTRTTTTPRTIPGTNRATYQLDERASAAFLHYLGTGEDPHGLVSPEVVAEMTFPHVAFRLEGKAAFEHGRDQVSDEPWELEVHEVLPTAAGFLAVVGATTRSRDGTSMRAHTISVVTLQEGRIVRVQHWCSGAL